MGNNELKKIILQSRLLELQIEKEIKSNFPLNDGFQLDCLILGEKIDFIKNTIGRLGEKDGNN